MFFSAIVLLESSLVREADLADRTFEFSIGVVVRLGHCLFDNRLTRLMRCCLLLDGNFFDWIFNRLGLGWPFFLFLDNL